MAKVGFIGLGKLGLACAQVMATKHTVTGYDIAPRTSDSVTVVDDIALAVKDQDIVFVAVQTPHSKEYDGSQPCTHLEPVDFDYSTVTTVLSEINKHATKEQLVVLISTCLPGTTRRELINCIPNARFIYNPYLIAMGSVEWDMVNPEMIIIGTEDGSTTTDAKILVDFYNTIMENNPRYEIGTWDEAEAIKIFYNTFISAKVGLANMIQDVAIKSGNINVDVVTSALARSTTRIMSPKYMKAGMGDAGPCHPRDNIALRWLAAQLDMGYDLFDAIMHAREKQAKNMADELIKHQQATGLPIYILGKAYKPEIDILDGSYSLLVGSYLEQAGARFAYIDPNTGDSVDTVEPCIALLAHNSHVTYGYTQQSVNLNTYVEILPGSVVVDPWREYTTTDPSVTVVHYGNTRLQ